MKAGFLKLLTLKPARFKNTLITVIERYYTGFFLLIQSRVFKPNKLLITVQIMEKSVIERLHIRQVAVDRTSSVNSYFTTVTLVFHINVKAEKKLFHFQR